MRRGLNHSIEHVVDEHGDLFDIDRAFVAGGAHGMGELLAIETLAPAVAFDDDHAVAHEAFDGGVTVAAFRAFAAAPETRKPVMIVTGVAALVILATGVRMWQEVFGFAPAGWLIVKFVCWLGLSALAGIGYRRREQAGLLAKVAIILVVIAVAMVYVKPF